MRKKFSVEPSSSSTPMVSAPFLLPSQPFCQILHLPDTLCRLPG